MRVDIDRDGCISCGLCFSLCPNSFYLAEDNKAHVTTDIVPNEFEDCVKEAADSCPVTVIHTSE